MDVIKKPPNWDNFVFSEKLKWYAKKDTDNKNVFADKYYIKFIIDKMNLDGLKYAKLVTHIAPFEEKTNLNIVLPVEQILKDPKYQFNQANVECIFKTIETPNEFWEIVKEKYDIERFDEDIPPPQSYVIKLNLSWNVMIFVCNNKIVKIVSGTHEFPLEYKFFYYWKKYVLKQYKKKIPPKFFMEEFIGYNLKVYEVYCIYGKPRILSLYYETSLSYENNYLVYLKEGKEDSGEDSEEDSEDEKDDVFAFENKIKGGKDKTTIEKNPDNDEEQEKPKVKEYTYSQKLIQGSHLIADAKPLDFKVDKKVCKEVCLYAQEFAQYFEFVRVDFYHHKGEIYFSECTFKPGALKKIKWMQVGKFLSKFWTKKPEI
jgi:hypothetical protein